MSTVTRKRRRPATTLKEARQRAQAINREGRRSARPAARRRPAKRTHVVKDTSNYCDAYRTDGSGLRCTRPRGWGTDHPGYGQCKKHGGSTPNGGKAAAKEEARELMPVFGIPVEIDPIEGLIKCVHISAGWVAWTMARVHEIREADWLVAHRSRKRRPLSYGKGGESATQTVLEITTDNSPRLNAAIEQHILAVERFGKFCKMAADVGVAQAQIDMAERYGQMLAPVVAALLDGLQLTARQRTIAPALVERAFLQLESGR